MLLYCVHRLGDGRVIVAPPGADLASLAADLDLVNKSDTSSDTSGRSCIFRSYA